MKKNKILFVLQRFYPSVGGTQNYSFLYAKELTKLGYDVDIVTTDSLDNLDVRGFSSGRRFTFKSKNNKLLKKETIGGINIFRFSPIFQFFTVMINPSMFFFLLLNIQKYYIVHIYSYMYAEPDIVSVISLIFRNIKIVHSPQDIDVPFEGFLKKLKETFYDKSFGRLTLKRSSKIIVLTNELKKRVKKMNIESGKIEILPIGIDFNNYKTTNNNKSIDILFVGRLTEYKGAQYIIKTLEMLKNDGIFPNTLIIGKDYGYKNILEKNIEDYELQNISINTNVRDKDLINFYRSSKFFIFPSSGEGFGGVVLEAISGGCYPILLKEKGLKDLLGNIGGYSIDKDKDISKQIYMFLKENHTKDFSNEVTVLQNIVKKDYNWTNIAKKLVQIYEKIQ